MDGNVNPAHLKELSQVLALEENPQIIQEFLTSLLTETEVAEISSRWALVRLIERGMSQRKISRELGLSLCKITRGSRELKKDNSPFAHMIQVYQKSLTGYEQR